MPDEASPAMVERAALERALEGIHGWLTSNEAWQLHEEVRGLAERLGRPLRVVEIGSWKGRSAIAMGLALAASGNEGRVFAIDPQAPPHDNADEFDANVRRAGVEGLVTSIRALSHDARPEFPERAVDLLFVDGAHDYPSVCRDLDDWTPLLSDGAVLVVNDLFYEGVNLALLDRIARRGGRFSRPRYVYNTIFFDHTPRRPWTAEDRLWVLRLRAFLTYGRHWLKTWDRIKADPGLSAKTKGRFFRPTSRLLYELGPKPPE